MINISEICGIYVATSKKTNYTVYFNVLVFPRVWHCMTALVGQSQTAIYLAQCGAYIQLHV